MTWREGDTVRAVHLGEHCTDYGWPWWRPWTDDELRSMSTATPLKGFPPMFKANTPLYLRDLTFKTETIDQETRKIVVCSFMAQPFTPEMATDLDIRNRIFSAGTAEPLPDVLEAKIAITVQLQTMTLKMAPDAPSERIKIPDVQFSKTISVAKDKEGPVMRGNFSASFRYPDGETLLYLANAVNQQLFVTFDVQQGKLIPDAPPAGN